ncbi:MAG: hypothetical protein DRJ15_15315 [Bacteroidetes bacterium]|nr:MAG: hypothetical protein DRJ15_15315 [Bacteroidota bacterium]
MSRRVSWFSCGAASAVATKLSSPDVIAYCETGSEDIDNARFMKDCEVWFGKDVTPLRSRRFKDTWDVWERERYLAGINGAPCTRALKVRPRLDFQREDDIHIFGYTADNPDIKRANALREHYPELTIETPLIDRGLTKAACLSMIMNVGIDPPRVYAWGFKNANCTTCVKATSPAYWALVRQRFPEDFARMVELSRRLNVRLTRIKGERVFIDQIPLDHKVTNPIAPECDFLCQIFEGELD